MLDFGALPPEIISARMYAGPGSAPMVAAASAWNTLAAELNSAAIGYEKVITQLTSEEWGGSASASMADAAAPYVAWMSTAGAQAEHTATQARAAAAAYESAFAATVPPPLIAANRAQVAQLTATNIIGQNTPAIAQLEAHYAQMWAQDSAAMYGYAGQSAAAAKVMPFASPAQSTNPAGTALQSAAVSHAASTAVASGTQSLAQTISATPSTLQGLATPATSASDPTSVIGWISQLLTGSATPPTSLSGLLNAYSPFAGFLYNTEGLPYFSIGMGNNFVQMAKTLGLIGGSAPAAAKSAAEAAGAASAGGLGGLGGLGSGLGAAPVSAGLGNATGVGRLVVPPSWLGSTPISTAPPAPVAISGVSAAPDVGTGAGHLMGGMPLAGAGVGAGAGAGPKYGFRPTVMVRPPFAG